MGRVGNRCGNFAELHGRRNCHGVGHGRGRERFALGKKRAQTNAQNHVAHCALGYSKFLRGPSHVGCQPLFDGIHRRYRSWRNGPRAAPRLDWRAHDHGAMGGVLISSRLRHGNRGGRVGRTIFGRAKSADGAQSDLGVHVSWNDSHGHNGNYFHDARKISGVDYFRSSGASGRSSKIINGMRRGASLLCAQHDCAPRIARRGRCEMDFGHHRWQHLRIAPAPGVGAWCLDGLRPCWNLVGLEY